MSMFREVLARERSREETSNNTLTQEVVDRLGELGDVVAPSGSNIVEPKKADNAVFALAGPHGGLQVEADGLYVDGAVGATFDRRVTVDKHATFVGCTFSTMDVGQASLVTVRTGAKAVFLNCRFQRAYDTPVDKTFVTVDSGGKAVLSGCMLGALNNPSTYGVLNGSGNAIVNNAANAATDCHVLGSVNHTTWAIVNSTSTGVI
jgi:hypothetical protein